MPPKQTKPRPRKTKRPTRPKKTRKPPTELSPDIPHWLPTGRHWDDLPQNIRRAVSRILTPAYRRFVLEAPAELERSVGLTLVHLMWLELCDQIQLATVAGNPTGLDAILKTPEDMIDRHLRLATVKCQTAELLLKLRVATEMLQRPPATPSLPSPFARGTGSEGIDDHAPSSASAASTHTTQPTLFHTEHDPLAESEIGKSPTC